jgi:type IV pilus assembly protein PilP
MRSAWIAITMLLSGCSGAGEDELRDWMVQARANVQARVQPLPEPKAFSPQDYSQEAAVDPFNTQRLTQALTRESGQTASNAALVTPEMARRKEPLEAYPLDAMAMVGSLNRNGQQTALLRADNLLYQVRVGNYLGLNYGRITRITESDITLREIVQDATGEWIERTAKLELQEKAR